MEQPGKSVVVSEVLGPLGSEEPAEVASPASARGWQRRENVLHPEPRCSVGLASPLGPGLMSGLAGVFTVQVPKAS